MSNPTSEDERFMQEALDEGSKGLGLTSPNPPVGSVHAALDPVGRDSHALREQWTKDNPDIVVFMHALRVELLGQYVMRRIVPETEAEPFLYWLRFEFGSNTGNPHAHGMNYVSGNPNLNVLWPIRKQKKSCSNEIIQICTDQMLQISGRGKKHSKNSACLLYTSPSPRDS